MIKKKFLELVLRNAAQNGLMSNDDLGRISLRFVEAQMTTLYADALALLIKDEASMNMFVKMYNGDDNTGIDIQYDRNNKEYYAELPIVPVQLQQNRGIVSIKAAGTDRKFYQATQSDIDLSTDMDFAPYYDRLMYIVDGQDRVRFVGFDFASKNIRKVIMRLVPDFDSYEWTDEIVIPSGRVMELTNLLAKMLFQQDKFKDTNSDSN